MLRAILIIAASMMLALPGRADLVRTEPEGGELRLTDKPCEYERVSDLIKAEFRPRFHAATFVFSLQVPVSLLPLIPVAVEGCWLDEGGGYYVLMETGQRGRFPADEFKPEN